MTDRIKQCDIVDSCEECPRYGDDCDGDKYLDRYPTMHEYAEGKRINPKLTDTISRADAIEAVAKLPSAETHEIRTETQTMNEQHSIDHDRDWIIGCIKHDGFIHTHRFDKANQIILEALQNEQRWIPFKKRPMTDEEREEYPDWAYIFDCPLPEDEEEILLTNGVHVWTDTFINDGECYLDGGDDIDDDMAWMPLPKPYKGGDDE